MSSRFWIIGGTVMLVSIVAGYSLGGFAGGRFGGGVWQDLRGGYDNVQAEPSEDAAALADPLMGNTNPADGGDTPLRPDQIVCKGCGPTLAERNMMGDAYAIGEDDPTLRDYEAKGIAAQKAQATLPPAVVATVQKGAPSAPRGPTAGTVQPAAPIQTPQP